MWVVDYDDDKVYAYNMPPSADHRLSDLTVSPKNLIGFATDRTSYEVGVASAVAQATITGTPANPNASVDYSGTDADAVADGHQVNLSAGRNEVTVTVTAEDGPPGLHGQHQPGRHCRLRLEGVRRPGRVHRPRAVRPNGHRQRRVQVLDNHRERPHHLRLQLPGPPRRDPEHHARQRQRQPHLHVGRRHHPLRGGPG